MVQRKLQEITQKIIQRSEGTYKIYQNFIAEQKEIQISHRHDCANIAHGCAALSTEEKQSYIKPSHKNVGIITAYNDMLSAHVPFEHYPNFIKDYLGTKNMTAQVAGGVPAMCDGVTQGQAGMDLSLFSREAITQGTAIGLCHNLFHGAVYLGACDKIAPALLMAALRFGHLPTVFLPAGPMPTGISNSEKAKVRADYAAGTATKDDLLKVEMASYHTKGTCTFYGTANSNQFILEVAGLHYPHTTFLNPDTEERMKSLRDSLDCLEDMIKKGKGISDIITVKTIVNMIVVLVATGGSTNLTIHMIAIAKMAGIIINWDDFHELSNIVPLVARVYPNGSADINDFTKAGGVNFVMKTLLEAGLLHDDVQTIKGDSLWDYASELSKPNNEDIIRSVDAPFSETGGIVRLEGNIGRGISKISAIDPKYYSFTAPAKVFYRQEDFKKSFEKGELNHDCVVVLPYQGPAFKGMPELHKLMPGLTVLQNRGYKVALLTDGRLSGASGKVSSIIHLHPEAAKGGLIGKISDGDMITIHLDKGEFRVESNFENNFVPQQPSTGLGRELFGQMRDCVSSAEEGATIFAL